MNPQKSYSESEADRFFAVKFFNQTWDVLEKQDRSPDEDDLLLNLAHASLTHWRTAGTPLNLQRGYWMLSRVHSVLNQDQASLRYAKRCLELTEQHSELMKDFDRAFAFEALARANAVAGDNPTSQKYRKLAEEAGQVIKDEEDRKYFFESLASGDWPGNM